MLELIKKLTGPMAKKELSAEGMANRKLVRGRRFQMIHNIMVNGLYEDTKRKAEFAVKDLPLGRTL